MCVCLCGTVFVLFFQNPWTLPLFIKMHRVSHWLYKKLLNQMVLKTDTLIRYYSGLGFAIFF